ncbi:uncharacterized protein LOC133304522 [Gastrolobium bilobum]|uniref:uncharacterized protein LOC133304522 n=1 Tax=Gastrolobium bilobum TaxID=150636 RepID=UPI002AAFC98C|nr:uncharacterized protein LOC133304522 [Gastrolobium bilobum]
MSSTFQAHTHHESEGDREFTFWGSSNTLTSENDCDQLGNNEARLNSQAEFGETYIRKNLKFEHHCSRVSDPSRSKAIAEGRKELMEMMQDMPESSYELSFQDMVVDEKQVQQPEPDQNETSINNKLMLSSSSNKSQPKTLNKKKKNKDRPGKILRVESMDSETFFLKMFFPTSLDWMKKGRVQNGSKVSPRQSLQEPVKREGKEWRIKRFFLAGNNKGDAEDGCDKSRYVDRSFSISHGCWPFFHHIKSKTKKLGG